MKTKILAAAFLWAAATTTSAQESAFEWEGSVEFGVDAVVSSDVATDEISDVFATFEFGATLAITDNLSAFALLKGESVTDPTDDRAFEDIGFFLEELGLQYEAGPAILTLGKFAPTFGRTWDEAAGYFNDIVAGDYELTETIGVGVDAELVPGGTLSVALFFADDTGLSQSVGTKRGRNTIAAGGAGNTGKLDNVTLAWTQAIDTTSFQIGVRSLQAGQGDVSDEVGVTASIAHDFGNGFSAFGEVANFDNFGGTAENAQYVTLAAAYTMDQWTFSGLLAHRDAGSVGNTDALSFSAGYEFANGISAEGGIAFVDEAGVNNTQIGASIVVPLGG